MASTCSGLSTGRGPMKRNNAVCSFSSYEVPVTAAQRPRETAEGYQQSYSRPRYWDARSHPLLRPLSTTSKAHTGPQSLTLTLCFQHNRTHCLTFDRFYEKLFQFHTFACWGLYLSAHCCYFLIYLLMFVINMSCILGYCWKLLWPLCLLWCYLVVRRAFYW